MAAQAPEGDEFVRFVQEHPRATIPEIAAALHSDSSYISRLKDKLISTGIVRGGGSEPWTVLDTLKPVLDETPDHPDG